MTKTKKEYQYDVFICHASEDKESFVRPLAHELRDNGLNVWYDEFSLKVGDGLRRSINKGLLKSKFGIVVLSQNFFSKDWAQKELNGLTALEIDGRKVILPIWHNIIREDITEYSPILADSFASLSSRGFKKCAEELIEVIKPKDKHGTLLSDTMQRWATHNILPSVDELYIFANKIDTKMLTFKESAFIYCSYLSSCEQIMLQIECGTPLLTFKHLPDILAKKANSTKSILPQYQIVSMNSISSGGDISQIEDLKSSIISELTIMDGEQEVLALYCFIEDKGNRALEVLLMNRHDFKCLVRYLPKCNKTTVEGIVKKLWE